MESQNRGVFRGQVTKLAKAANDYLASADSQPKSDNAEKFAMIEEELTVLLQRMTAARENLNKANLDVRSSSSYKPEDSEKELELTAEYEDKALSTVARLEHRLKKIRELQGPSISQISNDFSTPSGNTKLPKLLLRKFAGDFKEWSPFWEQFRTTVHENKSLSGSDKFNYLQSVITGKAADTIAGFTPTAACYDGAIALLQQQFGSTERIVDASMQNLMSLQPVGCRNDSVGLRRLYNSVTSCTRSLTALGVSPTHYFVMLKTVLLKCMPNELRVDFYRKYDEENSDESHSIEGDDSESTNSGKSVMYKGDQEVRRLLKFLKREVESLEKSNIKPPSAIEKYSKPFKTAAGLFTNTASEFCFFCKTNTHPTQRCNGPHTITQRKELLRRNGRCYRCTNKGHTSKICRVKDLKCLQCHGKHATSMCEAAEYRAAAATNMSKSEVTQKHTLNLCSTNSSSLTGVYLQTARAFVTGGSDNSLKIFVRLIIDGGSQRTYITQSVSRKLNLPVVGVQNVRISTFGNKKRPQLETCNLVRLNIQSQYGDKCVSLIALEVEEICEDVLMEPCPTDLEFKRFKLADVSLARDQLENGICILIGSDNYWNVVTGEHERITHNLTAVNTLFGWTLQGPAKDAFTENISSLSTIVLHSHIHQQFSEKIFWDLETIGIVNKEESKTIATDEINKFIRKKGSRYEGRLLWKQENPAIDSNREGAQSRFANLIRKLVREPAKFLEYENAMNELLANGIAEKVENFNCNESRLFFLPHRAVYRDDKATSKVRIVFDASAHYKNCASLNDLVSPGPNLLPDILNIILNFRTGKVGMVADIEKAFLQIMMLEEDRDVHRFYWFADKIQDFNKLPAWSEFRMTRVTFGIACSPFLLMATIRKHLSIEEIKYPDTCSMLGKSFYMDDLIFSIDNESDALKIYYESVDIMKRAAMNLRKWNSNSAEIRRVSQNEGESPSSQKVLGIRWCITSDELELDMEHILSTTLPQFGTKRDLLSLISRIYDPLGVAGPYIVGLKLIFQDTWKRKLKWDDILPDDLQKIWRTCVRELPYLKKFTLPRLVTCISIPVSLQLHLFADASTKAYGVVAYVKSVDTEGNIIIRYLCSKNRVAPLKEDKSPELTLPKLELTAALLAVRLCNYIRKHMRMEFHSTNFWSDSQIVLSWIQGNHRKWKPYISNRVQEINGNSNKNDWRHCLGKNNPADILTRGISGKKLAESTFWLQGPSWLKEIDVNQPQEYEIQVNDSTELLNFLIVEHEDALEEEPPVLEIEKHSDYRKLLRITAYVLRFIASVRRKCTSCNELLSVDELQEAERYWIKFFQKQQYADEIKALKNGSLVSGSSKIAILNPILDKSEILRVGTRLAVPDFKTDPQESLDGLFPIIIPRHSYLAKLIIRDIHKRMLHAGVNTLLAELRRRFWIPRGRQLIKSTIKPCIVCKRLRGKAATQPFSSLPHSRTSASRPFETCGVDFAGPLYTKGLAGEVNKLYIMPFTCSVIRAVHLELVSNLTTECCLMGLRRFIARRGVPKTIMSDNAKTYKRASKDLTLLGDILTSERLQGYLSSRDISWQFIVERAPWWGGFWERLVRSVKDVLKAAIGRSTLNAEQLNTFLAEAENIINSRPLTYISDDPLDLSPLTPAHFLKGFYSILPLEKLNESDKDLRSKWNKRLLIIKFFWKRWRTEYLNQLRSAHFSAKGSTFSVQEGDIVLVHDNLTPRLLWKLAIVESTYPGRDGKIRACEVRLPNGSRLRRPIQLLYPLEISRPEDVKNL